MVSTAEHSASPEGFDHAKLVDAVRSLLDSLPDEPISVANLKSRQVRELRAAIEEALSRLKDLLPELDPIKQPTHVLDPSDPEVIGRLIAETLLVQSRHALSPIPRFYGSGVYAIYYCGDLGVYQPIAGTDTPLYVGKADPARPNATTPIEQGTRLWLRLRDHRRSIEAATDLSVDDSECRYLVVRSAWQGTAETYLISRFRPIWNNEVSICYGFGKHGDDPRTRSNTRSPWDTLHPGRRWATKPGNIPYHLTAHQIEAQIVKHFQDHPAES